jgi:ferredoxin--NADP+ reductase
MADRVECGSEVDRPLRVAIIGSGPAGLYAAGHLLEQPAGTYLDRKVVRLVSRPVEVDVYERLLTPWGLVRSGVAPDHPNKKLVSRVFDRVAERQGFRFLGNVEVGTDIGLSTLREWYDAVIVAVGAIGDRSLGIPGEDLAGSWSARQFVGWYNGHPDFRDLEFDLSGETVAVIGNGNVALDVARILLTDPLDLGRTDVAEHALTALAASNVREVVILGRRGPAASAFNCAEFEELGHLPGIDVKIDASAMDMQDLAADWHVMRRLTLLNDLYRRPLRGDRKVIRFRYCAAPVEIVGDAKVTGLRIASGATADGTTPAQISMLPCTNVIRAVGYRCHQFPELPFDAAAGVIPNGQGRVLLDGKPQTGLYVTGWIKRGPRGVIGTNKKCARDTVRSLLADLQDSGRARHAVADFAAIPDMLREMGLQPTTYDDWRRIDRYERRYSRAGGRPRVKLTRPQELLGAALR